MVAESVLLFVALAGYLMVIAARLRSIARTLRLVNVGARAIERQTEPIGRTIREINDNLERGAAVLKEADQVAPGAG